MINRLEQNLAKCQESICVLEPVTSVSGTSRVKKGLLRIDLTDLLVVGESRITLDPSNVNLSP